MLEPDRIVEVAMRIEGLRDFGAPYGREALYELSRSVNENNDLSLYGRTVMRRELVRLCCNRLVLEGVRTSQGPAPLNQDVVVILGLPRSGTTFLHWLLVADRNNWYLSLAEALSPCRGMKTQIDVAEQFLITIQTHCPGVRDLHPMAATEPTECVSLLQSMFISQKFGMMTRLTRYEEFLNSARDQVAEAYVDYASALRILSTGFDRLVLKAPWHLACWQPLQRAFGARLRLVYVERPPVDALSSFVQLVYRNRVGFNNVVDPRVIAREEGWRWLRALTMFAEARAGGLVTCPVLDVSYNDLVAAPQETVHGIYEWAGWPRSPDVDRSLDRRLSLLVEDQRRRVGRYPARVEVSRVLEDIWLLNGKNSI